MNAEPQQTKAVTPLAVMTEQLMSPFMVTQLKSVLPDHITPERFQRTALTAIINNPDIQQCERSSVMQSLIKCAGDGLQPDGKEAAIVKFSTKDKKTDKWVNKAQYMPMAYGIIKRIRNSGEVSDVSAHVVYEKDKFSYVVENGRPLMHHEPNFLIADRGKLVFAYAVAVMKDGETHVEAVSRADIEKARKAGKSSEKGPWVDWYDEMAKKTAIHRLNKYVPTSAELNRLITAAAKGEVEDDEETQPNTPQITSQPSIIDQINDEVEEVEAELVDRVTGEVQASV